MRQPSADNHPIIVWFRNDLRLHDHAPLTEALRRSDTVALVYCIDPRQFRMLTIGAPKTGAFRARFLLESLEALREACRERGGELIVRLGEPEQVLPALAVSIGARALYVHAEVAPEEAAVERAVFAALQLVDCHGSTFPGQSLVHPDDLPFAVAALPDTFSQYRSLVEGAAAIRAPLEPPQGLPRPEIAPGALPSLAQLGLADPPSDARETYRFRGGESAALQRVREWVWEADRLRTYKSTRNGLLRVDDSSRLSPYLALGCLSARVVHANVRRYEQARVRNADTEWLIFELRWRDYFRLVAQKWGARLFAPGGLHNVPYPWRGLDDVGAREDFAAWITGRTGFPLVDAAMRELAATGYTSNRARQNVASFLTRVLGLDWRLGAAWFESQLVDYDVASNWGNWAYVAGVGNDARGFRFFNVLKQARQYDPNDDYTRHWITEPPAEYPAPMIDLIAAADRSAETYGRATAQRAPRSAPPTRR